MRHFLPTLFGVTVLVLLVFGGLRLLHLSTGTLIDWVIGIGVFWWLAAVVVLPWNTYFAAKDVLEEARLSREKGIAVPEDTVQFAQRLARRFLGLAVALHLLSALALYLMAYYQLTAVGYAASAAALLLTFARPAQRAYEHLTRRLQALSHQIHYPREDVVELRDRVRELESQLKGVSHSLDLAEPDSWAQGQQQALAGLRQLVDRLDGRLEELARQNSRDHEALARQSAADIARLSEDAQFLNQVRELIRFVKTA
jgi:predicted transcriptional regulator